VQKVLQALSDRPGHDLPIGKRNRGDDRLVYRLGDLERFSVKLHHRVLRDWLAPEDDDVRRLADRGRGLRFRLRLRLRR